MVHSKVSFLLMFSLLFFKWRFLPLPLTQARNVAYVKVAHASIINKLSWKQVNQSRQISKHVHEISTWEWQLFLQPFGSIRSFSEICIFLFEIYQCIFFSFTGKQECYEENHFHFNSRTFVYRKWVFFLSWFCLEGKDFLMMVSAIWQHGFDFLICPLFILPVTPFHEGRHRDLFQEGD
jgi:hypothetical protein